jgi:hypothetical protein
MAEPYKFIMMMVVMMMMMMMMIIIIKYTLWGGIRKVHLIYV